ncbi:MAG: hypothetical protein CBB70_11220 [Planctomycetaceae bacterium TMED10]|nr:MAG: hypothetical protein CBB70_11220 [Planctomycetaceae bacterium TMED10]
MPQIIAHRGASFDAPENTIAAITLAWQQRADAVEIDIRLTKDLQIVAIHDADTARTCDRQMVIAESTYAELRQADAGRWKGSEYQGERVPRFADILATLPAQGRLFVEVKCGDEIIKPLSDQLAGNVKLQSQLVLIGFNAPLIENIKRKLNAMTALLCVSANDVDTVAWDEASVERLIDEVKQRKLDGVDLDAKGSIEREAVERFHHADLSCCFWTVDDPADARQLAQCGVDGLTTNRPEWLRERFASE